MGFMKAVEDCTLGCFGGHGGRIGSFFCVGHGHAKTQPSKGLSNGWNG